MRVMLDKPRDFKVDLNAMCKFRELRGKEVWEIDFKAANSEDLRALLWCALLRDDPQLSLTDAGMLLDMDNIYAVSTMLLEASGNALPQRDKDDGSPNPAADGTGSKPGA